MGLWAATEVDLAYADGVESSESASHPPSVIQNYPGRIEALPAPFAVLDKHLANSAYVIAERFTVGDINTAEVFAMACRGL